VSGLFNEGLALFVYALIVLAIVVPIVLRRMRRPEQVREQEEVHR
jgi:hypothetical protein